MTEAVEIDLLRRFRVTVEGVPVGESVTSRGRELLALLVLEGGGPILRERIACRMWPESSEMQARTNLRRELHHLRRDLPQTEWALDGSGSHVGLLVGERARSDVLDVRRALERAAAARDDGRDDEERAALLSAARAYEGDLMPECFADWIAAERDRLRDDVAAAIRRLIDLLEARRDLAEATRWARRLSEIDPLDEVAYRAQMRLCAAAANRAGALHAFHRCASVLARELGVDPAPETVALYRELIADGAAGSVPPATEHAEPTPQTWTLVGRAEASAALLGAWRSLGPTVACILGEPGIGKSRLADEVAREIAGEGAVVARARAYAAEGQLSYGPVVDWLREPAVFGRLADLDPAWRGELGRLLPELEQGGSPFGAPPRPGIGDDTYLRRRLFEAVARALYGGSRPVVLLLDDLQWCDPETLALLHYLSRFERTAPRLVLVTARDQELADNEAARRLLAALQQEGCLLEVELGPLAASEVTELLRAHVGDDDAAVTDEAAERLYRASEGNPLFALEALRVGLYRSPGAAADASPPGRLLASSPRVRGVLGERLAQLGPGARELAQCAATIGRAFRFEVLREAAGLGERDLVRALDELWRRRIVRERPSVGYDFSHDALREAAARDVSPARAQLLHRRVAEALSRVHAAKLDEVSASIASHYELAGVSERAVPYYRIAARAASGVYAHRRGAALLERGLALVARLPPSRERDAEELSLLLPQMASLRVGGGYTDPGLLAVVERARALADALGDRSALFHALRTLWALRLVGGDFEGTLEVGERLRELARAVPELEGEAEHVLGGQLLHTGRFAEAIEHFEAARRSYDPDDPHRPMSVFGVDLGVFNCAWEAHALWLAGLEDRALESAAEAIRIARTLDHPYGEALAHSYAALLHYMRRDRTACAAEAEASSVLCERHGFAYYGHWGTLLGAWARADQDPEAAATAIRGALSAFGDEGAFVRRPMYLAAYAETLLAAGRRTDARAALDEARSREDTSGERLWSPEIARLRAEVEPADAVAHARCALELAMRARARPLSVRSAVTLALAMGSSGNGDRAHDVVRQALAGLPDSGSSRDRARALEVLSALR